MSEEFISEPIKPIKDSGDLQGMQRGETGLPGRFSWRDEEFAIAPVLKSWKEDGTCKSGNTDRYLRKHWYKIQTDQGRQMTLYFERQPRSASQNKSRWWLYTVD